MSSSDLPYIKSAENSNRTYSQNGPAAASTSIRGMAATVIEQAQQIPSKISFNRAYLMNIKTGILRLVLIVFLMCGWISAAAVPKNAELLKLFPDMNGTRSAYLFFTILAFLLYLALYIINLLNIINMDRVRQLPWNLITFALDVFFLITIFSCSVAAACRESQMNNTNNGLLLSITNRGAFGSAAAFGFMSVLILIVFVTMWVMYIMKERNNPKPEAAESGAGPTNSTSIGANVTASSGINQSAKTPQFKGFSLEDRTENI